MEGLGIPYTGVEEAPVRIRKPLHAIAIDPDRINRDGCSRESRTVAFIRVLPSPFSRVYVRKGKQPFPTPPTPSRDA